MEKQFSEYMVHPVITVMFPNNTETTSLFSWICNKITHVNELEEFIRWHFKINQQVIREIKKSQTIDFYNKEKAESWAHEFLKNYEKNIREMRQISNNIFQRFHNLKENEFQKLIKENPNQKQRINKMMSVFLNKKGLLIGKIIFSYREMWFVSNQILNSDFKIGSIEEYQKWINENLPNLNLLDESLKNIWDEIAKWKE